MKKRYILLLPAFIFMAAAISLKAQEAGGTNIVSNGEFEKWVDEKQPEGWQIGSEFSPEKVQERRTGGSGSIALKLWSNGGFIYSEHLVPVKEGDSYTFSFWCKGNQSNNQVKANVLWQKEDKHISMEQLSVQSVAEEWKKAERVVTVPKGADRMKISLGIGAYRYAYMLIDDVSMVLRKGDDSSGSVLEAPKNLNIKAHQGEMEISWDKAADKDVKWEVMFDGNVETVTSQNSYIKTKLKPGSEHLVKVKAIKGKEASAYVEKRSMTKKMGEAENSENRIPYLRTISVNGICKGRFLQLYYNELANPAAKISYKLNGMAVEPKENALEFPEFDGFYKQFRLEIHIDEGEGREWEILYPQLRIENSRR